jgi:ABC-2 type transport system ATP-binding protein
MSGSAAERGPAHRGWGLAGVSVRLGGALALDDVSLDAEPGQVAVVAGGDGAGKSTLLRMLAGVLRPTAGTVRAPAAARTGFLSASSGTYPDLTVVENLRFAATAYGMGGARATARIAELLARTGLGAVPDRLGGQLSGGMRQKLGLARALVHEPDLLILDEPTTGVDPVSRVDVWWLIAREAARGCAVVASTTYLDEAERAAHVLVLDAGRTLLSGAPADIVAGVPGGILATAERPDTGFAWRRAGVWRSWQPDGGGGRPDLQDAVVLAELRHEEGR